MRKMNGPSFIKGTLAMSLFASAAWFTMPGYAVAASIGDSVRAAIETNPEIGVVSSDRRAVDQELRQARGGLLPLVDLRAAGGGEWTDSPTTRNTPGNESTLSRYEAQLTLSQMLFDGFETESEIKRQRLRVDSAAYRVEEAVEFIALDAVEAHLDVLRNEAIVELNRLNVEAHRRILSSVREIAESDAGPIGDVRQTEARLATALENFAISEGSLKDSMAAYINVVGDTPEGLEFSEVPIDALPGNREAAAAVASTQSPTVKIAAADVDVSSAEARGSRAGFYPRFDIELSGNAADDVGGVEGTDFSASALVVMRYNLYRGGADIAREREAFHRTNESRATLRQVRRASEQDARVSYNALETARDRTAALKDRVEAQRRTRDIYGEEFFDLGTRDLLDLLDAENELLLARVSLTTAEFAERFAVYRVLAVVGNLINTLELERPRETISIHRATDDVQTPERIEEKSIEVIAPRSEPRPIRVQEAGEPPLDRLDIADEINNASNVETTGPALAAVQTEQVIASNPELLGKSDTVEFKPAAYASKDGDQEYILETLSTDSISETFSGLLKQLLGGISTEPTRLSSVQVSAADDKGDNGIDQIAAFLDQIKR